MALMMRPKPKTKKTSKLISTAFQQPPVRAPKHLDCVLNVIKSQQGKNGADEEQITPQVKEILQEQGVKCRNVGSQVQKSLHYGLLNGFLSDHHLNGKYRFNEKKYAKYKKLNRHKNQDGSKRGQQSTSKQGQPGYKKRKLNQTLSSRSISDESISQWQTRRDKSSPHNQVCDPKASQNKPEGNFSDDSIQEEP